MVYRWKDSFMFAKADARKVGKEYLDLEHKHGMVTPEAAVEFARSRKTEMHQCFTWDDTEAARQHRLQQARVMINHLVIVEETQTKDGMVETVIPIAENLSTDEGRGYVSTARILTDDDLLQEVLSQIVAGIEAYKRKLAMYSRKRKALALAASKLGEAKALILEAEKPRRRKEAAA